MRIKKRFFIFALIAVFFYLYLVKLSNYQPVLRMGINAFSGAEYFLIAKKAKFFEKAGLRIKLVEFGSLEDVQQAMEWHQIDGMICPLVDALVIQQKVNSGDAHIVFIPSYANKFRPCQLLVQPNIQSILELKNKRIGVEINSFGGYVLCRALNSYNLSLKDITLVPMDPTAIHTFITHHWVDGIVVYPPFDAGLMEKDFHSIYSTDRWPKEMLLNVFLINKTALQRFHKPLCRFFKSWNELLALYKTDPERCISFLSLHYSISKEASQNLLKAVQPLTVEEQIPLFCLNRYLIDVISNINTEILNHNNLPVSGEGKPIDHIFDVSLLRKTLSKNP